MEKVPAIISTKDLSYLSDMFEWNFVAYKKVLHYSNEVSNEEVKSETNKPITNKNASQGNLAKTDL